jgi:hypothetical protein
MRKTLTAILRGKVVLEIMQIRRQKVLIRDPDGNDTWLKQGDLYYLNIDMEQEQRS